jgi:hypothetical protein
LGVVVLLLVLVGCTPLTSRHLGIRPDEPIFDENACSQRMATIDACYEFKQYEKYTLELEEAYHSRATQNRFWIYASGTTALGTAAATAGVAALAASSSGTLVLLPIAGAFASSVFAVVDNPTLADIYTIAAGKLETAVQVAEARLTVGSGGSSRYSDSKACADAYVYLRGAVADAKNDLERARTDAAAAALQRSAAQVKQLNTVVNEIQDQHVEQALRNAVITDIDISTPADGKGREVKLTVSNVKGCPSIAPGKLNVQLDKQTLSLSSIGCGLDGSSMIVKFIAPDTLPTTGDHSPTLLLVGTQTVIPNVSGKKLKYTP